MNVRQCELGCVRLPARSLKYPVPCGQPLASLQLAGYFLFTIIKPDASVLFSKRIDLGKPTTPLNTTSLNEDNGRSLPAHPPPHFASIQSEFIHLTKTISEKNLTPNGSRSVVNIRRQLSPFSQKGLVVLQLRRTTPGSQHFVKRPLQPFITERGRLFGQGERIFSVCIQHDSLKTKDAKGWIIDRQTKETALLSTHASGALLPVNGKSCLGRSAQATSFACEVSKRDHPVGMHAQK